MSAPAGRRLLTHACPGCGGPGLPRERYACTPCWRRLPFMHRDRIMTTWSARSRDPGNTALMVEHHHAMRDAEDWYTNHPLSERTP